MKVLVDTCIWSIALRRTSQTVNSTIIDALRELITEQRVCIIGAIRQEVLSGIKSEAQFIQLNDYMSAFSDIACETSDYCLAAKIFNELRTNGIQASHIDALICAMAKRHHLCIMTLDDDFYQYAKVLDLPLYPLRENSP